MVPIVVRGSGRIFLLLLLCFVPPQEGLWCPMHPGVRSPVAGKCPICGMDLVPIPPRRVGEYRLDVEVHAKTLTLRVSDPDGQPPPSFAIVHERPFHVFIVSKSLEYFAHVHPELSREATFELRHELPAGEYMVIADFLPVGGTSQMLQRAIVTPGYRGRLFTPPPTLTPGPPERNVDGVRIRLDAELAPRKASIVRLSIADAVTGAPVADLEPYLGAAGHMVIVKADLSDAIHAHPEEESGRGGTVTFKPLLPTPGAYKVWVQFQRRGKVITAPFSVQVPE